VRIGLIETELVLAGHRVHQGQLGTVLVAPGRERAQQRGHRAGLPVEGQAEGMVGEQPRRPGPVTGRLQVAHGLGDLAVRGQPAGGQPVQLRDLPRQRPAQLQPEKTTKQMVVAEPGTAAVE
jgi:hypothetical protein